MSSRLICIHTGVFIFYKCVCKVQGDREGEREREKEREREREREGERERERERERCDHIKNVWILQLLDSSHSPIKEMLMHYI